MKAFHVLLLALAGACVLAVNTDARAYRAAGSSSQFPTGSVVVWSEGQVRYEVSDHLPSGLTSRGASAALWDGFNQWNSVACSSFRFVEVGVVANHALPGDGRNTIEWVDVGWEERGFGADAAAVSDVQYLGVGDAWRIAEVDLYLNAERFQWSPEGDETHKSVRAVATHEAGHLLGLAHPCEPESGQEAPLCDASFEGVAMHPLYDPQLFTLSEDDRAGVCALYPACSESSCGAGQLCTELGCRAVCGDSVCDADQLCLAGSCVDACRSPGCACGSDADCDGAFACLEAQCTAGTGQAGDSCSVDSECAAGICRGGAGCAFPCGSVTDCPGGADECINSVCQQGQSAFGEACDSASACTSGVCMTGVSDSAVCTRPCDPAATAPCPAGWACEPVTGRSVCLAPEAQPEEGCSVSSGTPRSSSLPLPVALFCLLGAAVMIRRRNLA